MLRQALLTCALALVPLTETLALDQAHPSSHAAARSGRSIYNLDETWMNQDGVSKSLGSLLGVPVVAAMGYTTCKDVCPATVANMLWIEKHLKPDTGRRVRFVFFSFDSQAD